MKKITIYLDEKTRNEAKRIALTRGDRLSSLYKTAFLAGLYQLQAMQGQGSGLINSLNPKNDISFATGDREDFRGTSP